MSDNATHMADVNAALAARREMLQRENDALRADLAALCALLRKVSYVQTVGEINRIRMTCDTVEARWRVKAVQP